MSALIPPFTGVLRQSEAPALRDWALAALESGAVDITTSDLQGLETGALQVFLTAARQARSEGKPCTLSAQAEPVFDTALAQLRLPPARQFFTIAPSP